MKLALAYLGVVLIWTTTPLAIKWSSLGVSFVVGVSARMIIGLICLLLVMLLSRSRLRLDGAALKTYIAVAGQLYLGMLLTYWSAQFLPSGWMSVIYGLGPFMTALMAAAFLRERSLGLKKVLSYLIGIGGLAVMFSSALTLNALAAQAVMALLMATFLQAASAIWIKRINAQLGTVSQTTGGLLVSLPLYLASWYVLDNGEWPQLPPLQTQYAIAYLGLIATPIGFVLYYYVLSKLSATNVAMINLITPVLSLLLGYWVNQEPLTVKVAIGTGLILLALALHTWADRQRATTISS